MPFRSLVLPGLLALLAGCAHQPAEVPALLEPTPSTSPDSQLHHVSGSLLGVPAGAEVELALLEVDRRDQPDRLLANIQLNGRGSELPFMLQFNPESFAKSQRVELRGRVTQSGQLILRLPPRVIHSPANQTLGPLTLVPAP